ncbi:MAG: hypothetical protein WC659_01345 [Patescibacteria group bacterium]
MPTRTISAKEVRLNLAKIWKALERGDSFQVIHRSKPIARITPEPTGATIPDTAEAAKPVPKEFNSLDLWINIPEHLRFKSKKSAVEIIRELRDE